MLCQVNLSLYVVNLISILKHETQWDKAFLDCMYGLGLHPLIDRPSRITTNSCTLIDNIFINQTNYLVRTGLLINDINDHLPIFALCNYEIDKEKCDTFKYVRNVKDDNVFLLIESLRQEKWDNVLQTDDVNMAYTNFVSRLSTLYNHHCPVEKVMIKQTYKKTWFTNGLKMRVVRIMFYTELKLRSLDIKRIQIN